MDAAFWLKLALSFIIGSLWVSITTLSAERFGSKVGGLIGGLPSTVVIALFFIGLTQSALVAAQATTVMPLAQGLNGLFVLCFMLLIKPGIKFALPGALLFWALEATLLFRLDIQAFWISLAGWLLLLAVCYLAVEKWMSIPSSAGQPVTYQPGQIIWRAVLGGGVISVAVLMGKLGGPLLGGIFGSFPAMFLSTLVITSQTGGAEFSRSVGKALLVSGLINVPVYEIMVRVLYPRAGLWLGTLVALLVTLLTGSLTFLFIQKRLK